MTRILRAKDDTAIPLSQAGQHDRPLAGLTVMVVEDARAPSSEAAGLLCLRSGARIRRADCPQAAARHLQTYRPGAIIVDMALPDGQGAELIAQISAQRAETTVLLGMSADPDARSTALAAGADGFLLQPVENLRDFQRAMLSARQQRQAAAGHTTGFGVGLGPRGHTAFRDDLAHVAQVLSTASDTSSIDDIVRLLTGVARTARDNSLTEAATTLARNHSSGRALAADLARISGLVHERLAVPAARVGW